MKHLFTLFFIVLSFTLNAQDMQKYLHDTQAFVQKGDYQEALARYVWFHENALEKDKAMQGVRLSFALSDWKALAEVYPPALKSLTEIRDTKTSEILKNGGSKNLFADVNAINRTLGESHKTISLFESVYLQQPHLAKIYFGHVKEDLFAAKRYDVIGKFIGNPLREYSVLVEKLNRDMERSQTLENGESKFKLYAENAFVEKSVQLIEFAIESDDIKTAKEIQQAALKVVTDYRLRDAISG